MKYILKMIRLIIIIIITPKTVNDKIILERYGLCDLFQTRSSHTSLFSPDWDFQKMGIGGLDDQFLHILRRAFASRVFPPDVVEKLGISYVKGLLLHGPPGMTYCIFKHLMFQRVWINSYCF